MMCATPAAWLPVVNQKNNMYKLIDTFNDVVISRHRTVEAAQRAMEKHLRAVRRWYGAGSYLTYEIQTANGRVIEIEEVSL